MEKPIEFGIYLQGLRKEKKYSLKIVADKLGIDISLLSKIENEFGDEPYIHEALQLYLTKKDK